MKRILLIEDELSSQLLYRNRLADLGYEVTSAETGAMGLMEARASSFDLFLVDVNLGSGIDGLEVCRRIKGVPELVGTPVVLISSEVKSSQDLHRGYEAGCQAFLKKGDTTLIEDTVRAMLRVKSLQDDLAAQNRLLEEQNRHLKEAQARGTDLEHALMESEARLPSSGDSRHPDGTILVDEDGICRSADRGARHLFGLGMEGKHLASLLPGSGLEALVRDVKNEPQVYRFVFKDRTGRPARSLRASVFPMLPNSSDHSGVRVVALYDRDSGRLAAELSAEGSGSSASGGELGMLREAARVVFRPTAFVGESPSICSLRARVAEVALRSDNVWLRGETGTERGLLARILHYSGERVGSFVPVDCASMSSEMLEREIRGYAKDAFPEAMVDRPGLLLRSKGGTLYLENAEALERGLIEELERVARRGVVRRLGSRQDERVDARICIATAKELDEELARQFAGFGAVEFTLPPLRERIEDVEVLARHYLDQHASAHLEIDPEALWALRQYSWPGNTTELSRCMETAARNAVEGTVGVSDLSSPLIAVHARHERAERIPSLTPSGTAQASTMLDIDYDNEEDGPLLKHFEKKALLYALERSGGDKLSAAKLAGVGKSTFYRKLKTHGIK